MQQLSFYETYKITKPIRLIELFAGIGAQASALERLQEEGLCEFETWRVCEFDKYAITSYNAVHETDFPTSDITQLKGADLGITETDKYEYITTYSFPCQDISVAGNLKGLTKGNGTRSGLLWEVERLLNECDELPQVLLMENVPNLLSPKMKPDFDKWCDFLRSKGYSNFYQKLNAKDFGIPQNRNRVFMVSILGNHDYHFPEPFELNLCLMDMLEDEVEEKYYLSDEAVMGLKRQMTKKENLT